MSTQAIDREIREVQTWAREQDKTFYVCTYETGWDDVKSLLAVSRGDYIEDDELTLAAIVTPTDCTKFYPTLRHYERHAA